LTKTTKMKKILYLLIIVASTALSSCAPCVKCTHASLPDSELCREDFDSYEEYNNAVDALEDFGYNCGL